MRQKHKDRSTEINLFVDGLCDMGKQICQAYCKSWHSYIAPHQFTFHSYQLWDEKRVNVKLICLNYTKQLGLKDNLRLKRGFSIEILCPHEYDIPLVRGGHLEGPHVFGFLICAFVSEL